MIFYLEAGDRWQAIDELMARLVADGKIPPENQPAITDAIKKREMTMSTGIGFGIAVPHATTNLITEVISIVGRSKSGIDFQAIDGKPVHIVGLFLVPAGQFQSHARILADFAKSLRRLDGDDQ